MVSLTAESVCASVSGGSLLCSESVAKKLNTGAKLVELTAVLSISRVLVCVCVLLNMRSIFVVEIFVQIPDCASGALQEGRPP